VHNIITLRSSIDICEHGYGKKNRLSLESLPAIIPGDGSEFDVAQKNPVRAGLSLECFGLLRSEWFSQAMKWNEYVPGWVMISAFR
jgi:hypothetical protein